MLGSRGPSGAPLGSGPWALATQVHRSHHEAPAEAPGSCWSRRGLRSVEPSQQGHCQDSRQGVGAAGTQFSVCSCPSSSGSAEPLPFLGKVQLSLSACLSPARRRRRKTIESHPPPAPSQSKPRGAGGGGRSILASESPPPRGSVPPDRSGERRGGEGGYPPGRHRRSEASGSPPPRLPPGGHCPTLGAKCPLGCRLGSDLARLKSRSLRVGLRWVAGGLTSALGPSRGRVCGRSDNPHTATQDRACTGPPQPPPPRSQGAGAFVFPKKPAFKCLTPCIFPKFGPSIPVGPSVLGDTVPVPSPLPLPQPCDPAETRARALLGARGCSCHPHPLTLPGPPRACFTDFQLWGKHGRWAWGQLGSVAPCLLQVGGRGQGAGQTSQSRLQKGDCLVCLRVCPRGRVRVPPPCARHPRVRESGQSTRLSAHTEAGPLGGGARVQPVRRLASPPSSEPARGERSPSVPRSVARDAALDGAWPGPELGAGAERRGAR